MDPEPTCSVPALMVVTVLLAILFVPDKISVPDPVLTNPLIVFAKVPEKVAEFSDVGDASVSVAPVPPEL